MRIVIGMNNRSLKTGKASGDLSRLHHLALRSIVLIICTMSKVTIAYFYRLEQIYFYFFLH